ncbi:high affinity immunoglobulin gamma Fc receptor I-like isoform X2 [Chaetodon auriga]|uniref:high affinity immunoglobulin gamma Fc receptor I-like isoform X2 n=1 Tax=Chaetodon auriga TaxID=39042 RepID=UPI0040330E3C
MRATLLFLSSVTVSPSRSQYFEYEKVSLSCEQFGSGGWTVWRYTTNGLQPVLSQCGSGWGSQTSSACDMKTVKLSDSGVYWCESKHRDSSNSVNITVTGGSVILQVPVLPVMEGDDVTLHCKAKNPPSVLPADFYKDGVLMSTEPTSHMIIRNFTKSDQSSYKCRSSDRGESLSSWLLMKDDSEPASLTASPNSSQLFEYENLSLSCGGGNISDGWKVNRATKTTASGDKLTLQHCGVKWGTPTPFGCILQTAKKPDSGIYWCESPAGRRSNSVNISVYDEAVILQSPVLPVMAGHDVTLRCKTRTPPSNLTTDFYKDGSLIRTEPTGHMTIQHVSRADEGLYMCRIGSHGESPPSWLFVRDVAELSFIVFLEVSAEGMLIFLDPRGSARSTADQTPSVLRVICHLVVTVPYCISTALMVSLYRHTGRKRPVSMAMSPPADRDEGLDQSHDADTADVTTEYHF